MALCALMGEGSFIKYVSLVSMSACMEARRPVQLACVLRLVPYLMGCVDVPIPVGAAGHQHHLLAAAAFTQLRRGAAAQAILPPGSCRLPPLAKQPEEERERA
jgi:hypothetical protein